MTDVFESKKQGFCPVFKSDGWQIATITYDRIYSAEGFDHMKRHLTTDEVFVLVSGEAVLHTIEDGKQTDTVLEKEKIYCVKKGTWHYLEISPDAFLAVAENRDLLPGQTERMELTCLLQKS